MNLQNGSFYAKFYTNGSIKEVYSDSHKLVGFDVARVEKWKKFKLPTLIFLFIFSQSVENWQRKLSIQEIYPKENLSKVNATATSPSCAQISSLACTLLRDVACRCEMNCVRSKDAHKLLAPGKIINGLSFVPSAFAAKHTETVLFMPSCPNVVYCSAGQHTLPDSCFIHGNNVTVTVGKPVTLSSCLIIIFFFKSLLINTLVKY